MRGGISKGFRRGCSAKPHARSVDNEPGFQLSARGNRSIPHRNAPDFVALALDFVSTFSADGPGHPAAQNQIVVRSVDDGVGVHFRQVALLDNNFL